MTAQASDSIKYRGETYSIAGRNGTLLFDPTLHGMKPVGTSSFCWRGYLCMYSVDSQRLLLDELRVNMNEPASVFLGIHPKPLIMSINGHDIQIWDAVYEQLRHSVPYTGGLLLARHFIEELYVHMGFHPAWKYRDVHELIFHDGQLVHETDHSSRIEQVRRKMVDRALEPGHEAGDSEIERWIGKVFSQEYKW